MPVPIDPPMPRLKPPRTPRPDSPLRIDPVKKAARHVDEGATPEGPRLPHERDLHRDRPGAPRPEMVQADADLRAGLEDTDCRSQAAETIAKSQRPELPRTRRT